jgi:hypothetical protein
MMYTMPKDSVTIVIVSNYDPLPNDVTVNDYAVALLAEVYRPVAASVNSPETSLRAYQIEGGRTLKIELPEHETLTGNIQLVDILGRRYTPRFDVVGNGVRVELDALPKGLYNYSVPTASRMEVGKIIVR